MVHSLIKLKDKANDTPKKIRVIQKEKNCSYNEAIRFYLDSRKTVSRLGSS